MRITSRFQSLMATGLFATSLVACTTGDEPKIASHEAEIANQEVMYDYYDCSNPDVQVGWRLHACTATNAWSYDGIRSGCYDVTSEDCSNPRGTIQYCDTSDCAVFDIDDPNLITYGQWFYSH